MKLSYFLDRKLEDNLIKVTEPDEISVTFADLFGVDNAVEVLQDIINYFDNPSSTVQPHKSYFLYGPLGTGKASLVYATAKEAYIPVVDFDASIFSSLATEEQVNKKFSIILKAVNKLSTMFDGCAIMFRNAEELECSEMVINAFYLNLIKHFSDMPNVFIFALSSTGAMAVPLIVKEHDFFATTIGIEYPNLSVREKLFEACIRKENIEVASDVSINRLAKETFGETPVTIAYIVKEAHLYSLRQEHEQVTYKDFSETILKLSAGESSRKMTEKEKRITAYHEAGHVIAGYFGNPEYILSRVEISPRIESLGLTVPEYDENKLHYTRNDYEMLIIDFLGGLAAEEVVYGIHGSGVSSDLQHATAFAANLVRIYGMHEDFGLMVVLSDITDSEATKSLAEKIIKELLNELHAKTKDIILKKRPYLDALAEALLEKEVVLGTEIEEIFKKVALEIGDEELKFNHSTSEK